MWVYILKNYADINWTLVEKGVTRNGLIRELRDGYENLEHQKFTGFLAIAEEDLKLLLFNRVWIPPVS